MFLYKIRAFTLPSKIIFLDTEFHRETTYYPKLCLIQADIDGELVIFDPIAKPENLEKLAKLLFDKSITKVMHSCRQDMEVLLKYFGKLPAPIFDTQIAAQFCGFGESVGYANLVEKLTGERMDKSQQFSDWQRRPLSEAQLQYALNEARQLRPMYDQLIAKLNSIGRLQWADHEMHTLNDIELHRTLPENAWEKVVARGSLAHRSSRFISVLMEVSAWREREAQLRDVPRSRIIDNDSIKTISEKSPRNIAALRKISGIRSDTLEKYGVQIISCVGIGLQRAEQGGGNLLQIKGRTINNDIFELLKLLLRHQAEQLGITASLIATRDDLESFMDGEDNRLTKEWRHDVFGQKAERLLKGDLSLSVHNGRVQFY
jgi:ribonuclease D